MTATAAPLQARIARLEQIVSGLQAQAGGGEQLSPNYLTVDAQGRSGASFTGLINALGLILPAAAAPTLPIPAPSSVLWERQSDGAVVAEATAFGVAGSGQSLILSGFHNAGVGESAAVAVGVGGSPSTGQADASYEVTADSAGNKSHIAFAGGKTVALLNNLGSGLAGGTSFVVNASNVFGSFPPGPATALYINMAVASVTFAASTASGVTQPNHGLPADPSVILLSCESDIASPITAAYAISPGSPFFSLQCRSPAAVSGIQRVSWIAACNV